MINLSLENKQYWQKYKPGEIPSVPKSPPEELISQIIDPILDVGTGDGILAEELSKRGLEVCGIDIAKNIIDEDLKRTTTVHYSTQDITKRTAFPDNYFGLIIFKFTLANIHKESWKSMSNEVHRVLKPKGKLWLLEPLVSESYKERYKLSSDLAGEKNLVYVFNDKDLAEKINSKKELQEAIAEDKVSRIIKHYTLEELKDIFNKLKLSNYRIIEIVSPSGYKINTFEGVFTKE